MTNIWLALKGLIGIQCVWLSMALGSNLRGGWFRWVLISSVQCLLQDTGNNCRSIEIVLIHNQLPIYSLGYFYTDNSPISMYANRYVRITRRMHSDFISETCLQYVGDIAQISSCINICMHVCTYIGWHWKLWFFSFFLYFRARNEISLSWRIHGVYLLGGKNTYTCCFPMKIYVNILCPPIPETCISNVSFAYFIP